MPSSEYVKSTGWQNRLYLPNQPCTPSFQVRYALTTTMAKLYATMNQRMLYGCRLRIQYGPSRVTRSTYAPHSSIVGTGEYTRAHFWTRGSAADETMETMGRWSALEDNVLGRRARPPPTSWPEKAMQAVDNDVGQCVVE